MHRVKVTKRQRKAQRGLNAAVKFSRANGVEQVVGDAVYAGRAGVPWVRV